MIASSALKYQYHWFLDSVFLPSKIQWFTAPVSNSWRCFTTFPTTSTELRWNSPHLAPASLVPRHRRASTPSATGLRNLLTLGWNRDTNFFVTGKASNKHQEISLKFDLLQPVTFCCMPYMAIHSPKMSHSNRTMDYHHWITIFYHNYPLWNLLFEKPKHQSNSCFLLTGTSACCHCLAFSQALMVPLKVTTVGCRSAWEIWLKRLSASCQAPTFSQEPGDVVLTWEEDIRKRLKHEILIVTSSRHVDFHGICHDLMRFS